MSVLPLSPGLQGCAPAGGRGDVCGRPDPDSWPIVQPSAGCALRAGEATITGEVTVAINAIFASSASRWIPLPITTFSPPPLSVLRGLRLIDFT